ncbi:GNAT family N-acetyltransferase [Plantibacter sp. CFBP 8775]|uniref:GNAT family N-acetyltransferase n=1 Tax=Plantibacter sp. CFBP 8775 TaxID=2774038 RepID=UPI00177E9BD7|nr:GNAT family N-acetyltransferase [Plantibacter sp. CFBP 8775]MBD8101024.1 GNAT family N-acetyltransferase [Plantibacter sp. CFBP 8775]
MIAALTLPATLTTPGQELLLRRATLADLDALMALLADDPISASRGDQAQESDLPAYERALADLIDDPANEILLVVDADAVIATMQLTRIPGMARRGSTRLLVEAVRVSSSLRSGGVGTAMMRWVTDVAAPATGSSIVQLTSDEARVDAHRFYERLGFVGSHRGFKYAVTAVS